MSIYSSFFALFLFYVATSVSRVLSFEDELEDMGLETERPMVPRPVSDPVREDDHEDFELYDIMALTLATVDYDFDVYTLEQKQFILELHHVYRLNTTGIFPQASDMMMFEYNNTLEYFAFLYLKHCIWAHGNHELDNMTGKQGQNLYKGNNLLLTRGFWYFYIEYEMYFFHNNTCEGPKEDNLCGHLTQMLWWNSSHLGTARRSYCYPRDDIMFQNTHYYRMGNWLDIGMNYVYKVGWPCTRCQPGYLCACGKFCVPPRYCRVYDLDCECRLTCKNCAKPDFKHCRCNCKPGWDWNDCSYPCLDLATLYHRTKWGRFNCSRQRRVRCNLNTHPPQMYLGCTAYCGHCQKVTGKEDPAELCCGGKVCEQYYELDENCECKVSCPGYPLCLYPPSTTTTETPTTTKATTTTTKATTTTTKAAEIPKAAGNTTNPSPPNRPSGAVAVQPSLSIVVFGLIYLPLRLVTSRHPF